MGAAAIVAVVACVDSPRTSPSFAVSDSAGVEVVFTRVPIWASGRPWTLEPAPSLRIGVVEGDGPQLFEDIRDVVLLDDGRIVVADGLSREIRFFHADGAHDQTAGGFGQGPGEFENLYWVDVCGEGLYAFDNRQRRVSVWSLEGELQETFALLEPTSDRVPYKSRCGPGGQFVIAGWGERRPPDDTSAPIVLYQQEAPLWLVDPATESVEELGKYISSERVFSVNPVTGGRGSGPHPFGRSVVFTLDRKRVFVGASERLQVEVRSHGGRLLRILRGPEVDLTISSEIIGHYRSVEVSRSDSILRNRLEENDMPIPPLMPAYTRFILDPLGNLWVERFTGPWPEHTRWGVFSAAGEFYGHLDMPEGFRLMDVANDRVVGVSEDEFEVERVDVYLLHRN